MAKTKGAISIQMVLWGLALAVLFPTTGWANYQDVFGVGSRIKGMGGSGTALATDYVAAYYNPAGLVFGPLIQTAVGIEFTDFSFDVSVEKDGDAAREAEDVEEIFGVQLGISFTFGGGVEKKVVGDDLVPCENCDTPVRLSASECPNCKAQFEPVQLKTEIVRRPPRFGVGLSLHLPFKTLVGVKARDAARPQFFTYDNNIRKVSLHLGAAVRIYDWLSVGAGASLLADATVDTVIESPLTGSVTVNFEQGLTGDMAPNVGVRMSPLKGLWFGLTYRGEISLKVDGLADTQLAGITAFVLELEAITLFSPHQVAFGVAYQALPALLLTFDLTYYNWSAFDTTSVVVQNGPGGISLNTSFPPDIGTKDIVAPRFGVEYRFPQGIFARFGYGYYPTFVKDQDGDTSILESDRHTITLGAGYRYELFQLKNEFNFFVQFHFVTSRTNEKSDPSNSFGDSKYDGFVFNLGFAVKTEF